MEKYTPNITATQSAQHTYTELYTDYHNYKNIYLENHKLIKVSDENLIINEQTTHYPSILLYIYIKFKQNFKFKNLKNKFQRFRSSLKNKTRQLFININNIFFIRNINNKIKKE